MYPKNLDAEASGGQGWDIVDTQTSTGELLDALTELYRLDLEFWGDSRTAQVFRCVAAANYKDGRAATVSGIAAGLELGVATVHARLKQLESWRDGQDGARHVLVERVPGGYHLTVDGERQLNRWLKSASARSIPKLGLYVDDARFFSES